MSKTITSAEPADRPFTVALSAAEIDALVNHHTNICRKIPKKVGAAVMGEAFENPFISSAKSKALFAAARALLKAHSNRANELNKLLP